MEIIIASIIGAILIISVAMIGAFIFDAIDNVSYEQENYKD